MKQPILIASILLVASMASAQTSISKKDTAQSPPAVDNFELPKTTKIDLAHVDQNINHRVEVQGLVADHKAFEKFFLIDLGAAYPNQKLTILLTSTAFERFKTEGLDGKTISVKGLIILYEGKPEIIISRLDDIKVVQ